MRILLEELSLPYEWEVVEFDKVKGEDYLQVTPNGRLPAVRDRNTGVTLWEVRSNRSPLWTSIQLMLSRPQPSCST